MLRNSHLQLGIFLSQRYLSCVSKPQTRAFLFGCIEPDKNPFTYLKGSIRFHPLHGHNYSNAAAYMSRLAHRLKNKKRWSLLDYYSLGKLIHYIADAFTHSHNEGFPPDLILHRKYEAKLQHCFLPYLRHPQIQISEGLSASDTIANLHRIYRSLPPDILHDTRYAINACCSVMDILTAGRL